MIFKLAFVTFILSFPTPLKFILASGNDKDVISEDNLVSPDDDDASSHHYNSSGTSSGSKRSIPERSSLIDNKTNNRVYHVRTNPLNPKIDDEMVNFLKIWEQKLIDKGTGDLTDIKCVWEKYDELTTEDAKDLCIEAWKIQVQQVPEIKVTQNMVPDCYASSVAGPSNPRMYKYYKGYSQYLDVSENKIFWPDMVRCNCAYLELPNRPYRFTVTKSKKYFFLYKFQETIPLYCIFTIFGEAKDRNVRLIDVVELNVRKP